MHRSNKVLHNVKHHFGFYQVGAAVTDLDAERKHRVCPVALCPEVYCTTRYLYQALHLLTPRVGSWDP
jgi:hypothetical protein